MDDKQYWVGFNLVAGIGAVRLQALIDHFGDAASAWHGEPADLRAAGLGQQRLSSGCWSSGSSVDLDKLWERIAAQGIQILTWQDEKYPARLKEIEQPPPVLYIRGELLPMTILRLRSSARAGSRRMEGRSPKSWRRFLAANGITVISGLARGVDALAHPAALKAVGEQLACSDPGVDQIYPPENRALAEQMMEARRIDQRLSGGHCARSYQFPAAQSHHFRVIIGGRCDRSRRDQRRVDHRRVCRRAGTRSLCSAGQHTGAAKQRHEQADPEWRTAIADAAGPDCRRWTSRAWVSKNLRGRCCR